MRLLAVAALLLALPAMAISPVYDDGRIRLRLTNRACDDEGKVKLLQAVAVKPQVRAADLWHAGQNLSTCWAEGTNLIFMVDELGRVQSVAKMVFRHVRD